MTQTTLLGDLITIKHGYAFKGQYFSDAPTENILITPGNFEIGGGFKRGKLKYYNGPIDEAFVLEPGDTIVTMTDLSKAADTLGFSARVPDDNNTYLHNQRIGLVGVKSDVADAEYIYWLMRSPDYRRWIVAGATGSTVKHTAPSKILSYKFNLPNLETQKKIADILGTIDEKIELNRQMNETLEQMGQALFRHYSIDNPEAGKWEDGAVSDLITIYSGYAFKRTDFDPDGEYGLVTIKNVQDGNFVPECSDYLSTVPAKTPDYAFLKTSDILLSLTGNVGRVCIVHGENLLLNQRVAKLVGADGKQSFAYFMFRQEEFKNRLISMSRGTAQLNLSPIETKKLKMKLPPKELLSQYHEQAEPLFETITANYTEIQTLTTLRDTLLPRLISGKMKV